MGLGRGGGRLTLPGLAVLAARRAADGAQHLGRVRSRVRVRVRVVARVGAKVRLAARVKVGPRVGPSVRLTADERRRCAVSF